MEYNIRPLSFAEILDRALRILVDNAVLLIGISAIVCVPEKAVAVLGVRFRIVFLIVWFSAGPLLHSSLTSAIADVYLAKPVTIASAYKSGWSVLLPFFGTYLFGYALMALVVGGFIGSASAAKAIPLMALFAVLGFIVFVPLMFFLLIRWSLIGPIMIVERRFGLSALRRSRDLVAGVWWRTFGIILVATLIVQIPMGALRFLWSSIPVVGIILSGLGTSIAAAYSAVAILVYYFDRRCRIEDFDLRLLAEQIRSEGAQASPAMTGVSAVD
jgi:hypothetical protein